MLDGFQQLRIFLAHDLCELRRLYSGLLQLLEGSAGIDALVLPNVSDEQHAVLRSDLFEEVTHLFRTGEARFIDQIQVTMVGIARRLWIAASEESLEGVGGNARITELMRGAGGGGEPHDLISALFRTQPDGL
jgi:hypothetical protein